MSISKFNYKIKDKRTGKFLTGSRSKATWLRASAVVDFIEHYTQKKHNNCTASDLEVAIIPLTEVNLVSAYDFIADYNDSINKKKNDILAKENDKKLKLENIQKVLDKMCALVPSIDAYDITYMYVQSLFNDNIMQQLKPVMEEYNKLIL
jgi:hypothetical protein